MPWARSRSSCDRLLHAVGQLVEHLGRGRGVVGQDVLERGAGSRPGPRGAAGRRRGGCARSCGARRRRWRRCGPGRPAAPRPVRRTSSRLCLEGGVELHVVEGQADLAGQLGEHPVLLLGERVAVGGPLDHDQAEQLARVGDRGRPALSGPSRPSSSAGSHTAAQALPDTPARATTGSSVVVELDPGRRPRRAPTPPARAARRRRSTPRRPAGSSSCAATRPAGAAARPSGWRATAGCRRCAATRRAPAARRRRGGWRPPAAAPGPGSRQGADTPAAAIDRHEQLALGVGRHPAEADDDDQVDAPRPRRSARPATPCARAAGRPGQRGAARHRARCRPG